MNQQYHSKAVLSWADNQKVVSGNHCRLIDSYTKKNSFQFDGSSLSGAFEKNYIFSSFGGIK